MQKRPLTGSDIAPYNGSVISTVLYKHGEEMRIGELRSLNFDRNQNDSSMTIRVLRFFQVQLKPGHEKRKVWIIVNKTLQDDTSFVIEKPEITEDGDHLVFMGKNGEEITITQEATFRILYLSLVRAYARQN